MGFFDSIGDWFGDVGGEISDSFSDLTSPEGLRDFGNVAGMAAPFFAPLAVAGASGALAGGAGLGAAEGAGALGYAAEAGAAAEGGLPSWFSGMGEAGMAGGTVPAEAGGGLSEWLALTAPEGAGSGASAGGLEGTFGGAEDAFGSMAGAGGEGGALEFTGGMAEDALGAGGAKAGGSFWDKIVGGATASLTKNPLGIGAAAIGLGANMLKGQKDSPEMEALRGQAGQLSGQAAVLNAQGQQLASYLQSGTLPPGLASSVKQAADAYKARVIQNHARNGMSTDPTQNSALAQELAQADMNAVSMTASLGQQLMQSGQNFLKMGTDTAGLSERIYESLVRLDREQSRATGQAIASFAAALGGGQTLRLAA